MPTSGIPKHKPIRESCAFFISCATDSPRNPRKFPQSRLKSPESAESPALAKTYAASFPFRNCLDWVYDTDRYQDGHRKERWHCWISIAIGFDFDRVRLYTLQIQIGKPWNPVTQRRQPTCSAITKNICPAFSKAIPLLRATLQQVLPSLATKWSVCSVEGMV